LCGEGGAGPRFFGLILEEVRACIFAITASIKFGLKSVILEGDCWTLINKLKNKDALVPEIALFMDNILSLCKEFEFVGFSFVRR